MTAEPATSLAHAMLRPDRVVAAIVVALLIYMGNALGALTRFPGTLIDARLNQVILEHLWNFARGHENSLSNLPFFYPASDIIYLSETHYGAGAFYILFRALGASREVAFDLWFVVGMASSMAAALYVLRKLGLSFAPAWFGGAMFAFSLPMLAQDAHLQLVYRFPIPLATLAALSFVQKPNVRAAAATMLWASWQFLCSVYLGVFLIEWLGLILALAPLGRITTPLLTGSHARDATRVLGALAAALFAAWLLAHHAEIARAYDMRRSLLEFQVSAPTWRSLLSMTGAPSVSWLAQMVRNDSPVWDWEHQLCPGPGLIVLAFVGGLASWRDREGRRRVVLCLAGLVGLYLINMDFGGYGLYRLWLHLPGFNAIRAPGRVSIVAAFPLAWLGAMGVNHLLRPAKPELQWLAVCALAIALLDIATFRSYTTDIATSQMRVSAVKSQIDPQALASRGAVLATFGKDRSDLEVARDLDLVIAAQDLGLLTANGYSSSYPPNWRRWQNCEDVKAWLKTLPTLPRMRPGGEDTAARLVFVPGSLCQ